MTLKLHNKLVRDKIPEILEKKGIKFTSHSEQGKEYFTRLVDKLQEETAEFSVELNEEELADILEVIDAIIKEAGFSQDKIESIRIKKFSERGGFSNRIILDTTDE